MAAEVELSVAVMAHRSREDQALELAEELGNEGGPAPVVWDLIGDRWDTGRRSLLEFNRGSRWHLVVQDDAILAKRFLDKVRDALRFVGPGMVAFYTGRGRLAGRPTRHLVMQARRRGASWIRGPGPLWGVAIAVRTKEIEKVVEWCDNAGEPANYDLRLAAYNQAHGRLCWYSVPCLVDHRVGPDNPSLVEGRGSSRGRTAILFDRPPFRWSPRNLTVGAVRRR